MLPRGKECEGERRRSLKRRGTATEIPRPRMARRGQALPIFGGATGPAHTDPAQN